MVNVQSVTIIGKELAQHAMQMAEVIAGSKENLRERPLFSSLVCTIAPLGQDTHGIEGAMVFAEAGIPVGFMVMPNIGSTSPATMGNRPQSDIRERARHRFEKILVEHQPDPLPEDNQIVLQNILKAAESQEANEGLRIQCDSSIYLGNMQHR